MSIQACAFQTVFSPGFYQTMRSNPACATTHPFLFESDPEGHAYFQFCVNACRQIRPAEPYLSDSIEHVIERHPEPRSDKFDVSLAQDFRARLERTFPIALGQVLQALTADCPAATIVERCILPIQSIGSCDFFLATHNWESIQFLRSHCESLKTFEDRSTLTVLAFLLMKSNLAWRFSLAKYFVWMCRLTVVLESQLARQEFIYALAALQHMEHLIDQSALHDSLRLLSIKRLPSVSPQYNPPGDASDHATGVKRKSRFDVGAPAVNGLLNKRSKPLESPSASSEDPQSLTKNTPIRPSVSSQPDPDKISGGLLAHLLKQVSKRSRNIQVPYIPYRPIDPQLIPPPPPVPSEPTAHILERLADLDEDIQYETKLLTAEFGRKGHFAETAASRAETRRGPDDKLPSRRRLTEQREFREPGGASSRGEANWEKPLAWAQAEMGIAEDGGLLFKPRSSDSFRPGLGVGAGGGQKSSAADDLFDEYRQQRAQKYHQTIAQAYVS